MNTLENNRILIIDDNTTIYEDFCKVLTPKNVSTEALNLLASQILQEKIDASKNSRQPTYQIEYASQGKDGFNLVQKSIEAGLPYAMAFVDVCMPPGWDGIETIKQIWTVDPEIQIAICTAYSEYSWKEITAKLGFTDQFIILKKPFDDIEILQMACSLVTKWNLNNKVKFQSEHIQHLLEEQSMLTQEVLNNQEMIKNLT